LTGISEILVLILIIACILILPRMMQGENKQISNTMNTKRLSVKTRVGIVFSFVYPIAVALVLKPWNHNLILFLTLGISPMLLGWAIVWIFAGFKKK
jgi:hypothetical protein